jgi:hypothetical protein
MMPEKYTEEYDSEMGSRGESGSYRENVYLKGRLG